MLKLNLGCGNSRKPDYLNVDKFGSPDLVWDLEQFPWPWRDSSVDEIVLHHVLEHLGSSSDVYLRLIQELYRVCRHGAIINIDVPHPRHDWFITDPTHCRIVTPASLAHFDQEINREWIRNGSADTPLGIYLAVDLRVRLVDYFWSNDWFERHQSGELTMEQLWEAEKSYFNVMCGYHIELEVIKDAA